MESRPCGKPGKNTAYHTQYHASVSDQALTAPVPTAFSRCRSLLPRVFRVMVGALLQIIQRGDLASLALVETSLEKGVAEPLRLARA